MNAVTFSSIITHLVQFHGDFFSSAQKKIYLLAQKHHARKHVSHYMLASLTVACCLHYYLYISLHICLLASYVCVSCRFSFI